mmetsp:Transcript_10913/g.29958  ORF Transcript_10913/g.29958 Transcript_10913/m.29958 type:complete len:207 (-) Transcript_10913:421-1041(-)
MKCETSAMCTPTRHLPGTPSTGSTCIASSKSLAVGGSMENTRAFLKSRRNCRSSGVMPIHGVGGKQASTSELKSSRRIPSISKMAAVSVSISPAWPKPCRNSTRGASLLTPQDTMRAEMSVLDAVSSPGGHAASALSSSDSPLTEVAATTHVGIVGERGTKKCSKEPPTIRPDVSAWMTPTNCSLRELCSKMATTWPQMRRALGGA